MQIRSLAVVVVGAVAFGVLEALPFCRAARINKDLKQTAGCVRHNFHNFTPQIWQKFLGITYASRHRQSTIPSTSARLPPRSPTYGLCGFLKFNTAPATATAAAAATTTTTNGKAKAAANAI